MVWKIGFLSIYLFTVFPFPWDGGRDYVNRNKAHLEPIYYIVSLVILCKCRSLDQYEIFLNLLYYLITINIFFQCYDINLLSIYKLTSLNFWELCVVHFIFGWNCSRNAVVYAIEMCC